MTRRYHYFHGDYDLVTRRFCGFGRVEQWDAFTHSNAIRPHVYKKFWFHTGRNYAHEVHAAEYYAGDARAYRLPAITLPAGLSPEAEQDAAAALQGRLLREESYAGDETERHPYWTTTYAYTLAFQPSTGEHAPLSCVVTERERLTYIYERNPADPRVQHRVTLETDTFGNTSP